MSQTPTSVSIAEFRKNLVEFVSRVQYRGEVIVITRFGKAVAQLAPHTEGSDVSISDPTTPFLPSAGKGQRKQG